MLVGGRQAPSAWRLPTFLCIDRFSCEGTLSLVDRRGHVKSVERVDDLPAPRSLQRRLSRADASKSAPLGYAVGSRVIRFGDEADVRDAKFCDGPR